jgi:gas vesicle protein
MAHKHSVIDSPTQLVGIAAIAAGVGALTAILIAPKSGFETRQEIRARAMNMRERMRISHEAAGTVVGEATDKIVDTLSATKQRANHTIHKIKNDATLTSKELGDTVKQSADDIQDEADHIRKHGER